METNRFRAVLLTALLAVTTSATTTTIILRQFPKEEPQESWTLISERTTATVYNAEAEQCNADYLHTASNYTIIPSKVASQRILAMERTMMQEFGLAYGDLVLIEGAGRYDGVWQLQDTMNARFAGKHRIDFLVPSNIRHGLWRNVKVYIPATPYTVEAARKQIASL